MSLNSITALLCAALFTISGCSSSRKGFSSADRLSKSEIPQEFLKEHAVLLVDEERIEIMGSSAIHEQRIVKKILKPGHPEEGVFRFRTNKYRKILAIEGRAVYPDGRERVLSHDDIVIVPDFEEFILYSDQKSHSFRFPGTVAGTVIEVYIKRKINNLVYWEPALFKRDIPVLTRRYTLIHPSDLDFDVHASFMEDTPSRKAVLGGGKKELIWEKRNIEPFRRESMMPPGIEYFPALWFSVRGELELGSALKLDSWSGVVEWYQEISRESLEPDPGLRLMLDTLCIAGMSERETAARLFRWVQANLRYVAIYLGDDGFRPHETGDILTNRYGDCKDKSVVLTSALREVGIDASLVLVRTVDLGHVPGAAPSPAHFNHVIVTAVVDGDTVYLDPTCETCSFGIIPIWDQNAEALVIRDGENSLKFLPFNYPRPNRSDISLEIAVASDGDANVTVNMEFDGHFAAAIRRKLIYRKGKSRFEVVAELFKDKMPAARMEDVMIVGEDAASDILTIKIKGKIPEMIDTEKSISFIQVVSNPLDIGLPDCNNRIYPIALGAPIFSEYEMSLLLPEHWYVAEVPTSGKIQNDYFEYSYAWNSDGRKVRFSRSWSNEIHRVHEADCEDVRNQLESVVNVEKTRILAERMK